MVFSWSDYLQKLDDLRAQGARVFTVGYSVLGRPIYGVFKGSFTGGQVLIQAAMHAREGVTTPVVLQMMENYTGDVGIWCLPMVNPDGVQLADAGLSSVTDEEKRAYVLEINGGSEDFSLWKANINAVDLNVNFPAKWGTGSQNVTYPSPGNYIGEYPLDQPESRAIHDFTLKIQPSVRGHLQGLRMRRPISRTRAESGRVHGLRGVLVGRERGRL